MSSDIKISLPTSFQRRLLC